ncbi:MAG: hypothetical protein K8R50_10160 [Betaproteobacteria bacterium]|nr:hypothetical protein [Betaproteobacteria bacterium]
MDISLTHVTLRFNVSANQLSFAVSLSNRQFRISTGLRQAQAERRLVTFSELICYMRYVDTHYPEFPIPAKERPHF